MSGRVYAIILVVLLTATGCSSSNDGSTGAPTVPMGADAPSRTELQSMLAAEFARLGIDPAKVTAKAPQKSENAVFDLAAGLVDPDGTGGDPPTGITLSWTERLVGDYNQDGMVTESDLTPLGQNYCFDTSIPQVTYDEPGLHGGIAYWPTGDPDDDDDAMNWRLARVDGNNDGRIYQSDMTPIAVHWQERLTGYRVWRKAPGLSFELVPNPAGAGSDVTLARPTTISASAPVIYDFMDGEANAGGLGDGVYAYYVEPYDGSTSTVGPASLIVVIDTTQPVTPEQPVAALTVTPDFAGAPAVITLDASGSTDSDGTVEVYNWDFDADGTTDWVSTDPVPEESSAGTVDTITPVSTGIVTVTYRHGSADWYHPRVIARDNDGLISLPAYGKLGVSGWEHEIVSNDQSLENINFRISAVGYQPDTGIEVAAGHIRTALSNRMPWTIGRDRATYFAWCNEPGDWTQEKVANYDTPAWKDFFEMRPNTEMEINHLFWDENNQPGLLIRTHVLSAPDGHVYVAQRSIDGAWTVTEVYAGVRPLNLSHRGIISIAVEDIAPGKFVAILSEIIEGGASGTTNHYYALWYDNGSFSIEDIGVELHSQSAETGDRYIYDVAVDSQGTPHCLMKDWRKLAPNELLILRRESAENWIEERWDNGDMSPSTAWFMMGECVFDQDDNLLVSISVSDNTLPTPIREYRLYRCNPGSVVLEQFLPDTGPSLKWSTAFLGEGAGVGSFVNSFEYYHCRLGPDLAIREEIWPAESESNKLHHSYRAYESGKAYSAMFVENYDSEVPFENYQVYSRRQDPRY